MTSFALSVTSGSTEMQSSFGTGCVSSNCRSRSSRHSAWRNCGGFSRWDDVRDRRNPLRSLPEYSQELSIVTIRYSMCMGFSGHAGVNQYAQRTISTPDTQDGPAWQNSDGTWDGPIGENVAKAIARGYTSRTEPYRGYFFQVLKGQCPAAPLGELDYVVKGVMIGGFALIAAPRQERPLAADFKSLDRHFTICCYMTPGSIIDVSAVKASYINPIIRLMHTFRKPVAMQGRKARSPRLRLH